MFIENEQSVSATNFTLSGCDPDHELCHVVYSC